jgi:hypothetical protein
MNSFEDKRAAIVCGHVATKGLPILCAIRTEPIREEDSGWEFLCYTGLEENENDAKVWAVDEVISLEPSLIEYIDLPVGTKLTRKNKHSKWELTK